MNEALKQLQQQVEAHLLGQQIEVTGTPFPGYLIAQHLVALATGANDVDAVPAVDLIFRILSAK